MKTSSASVYELLDSGDGRKLERLGGVLMERQAATAFWKPRLDRSEWTKARAVHVRSSEGGGHWDFRGDVPTEQEIEWGGLRLKCKFTSFGHTGFFAEQASEWEWLRNCQNGGTVEGKEALNLFAYTGGSTLALAQAGFKVTHIDAAKGVVDWARDNAVLNAIDSKLLRFMVEDVFEFLAREKRRERRYDAMVLDPPSFGRGPKKQLFKLEEQIHELLEAVLSVLAEDFRVFHLSMHTPGFSPLVLKELLSDYFSDNIMKQFQFGELSVPHSTGERRLPSGVFARVYRR